MLYLHRKNINVWDIRGNDIFQYTSCTLVDFPNSHCLKKKTPNIMLHILGNNCTFLLHVYTIYKSVSYKHGIYFGCRIDDVLIYSPTYSILSWDKMSLDFFQNKHQHRFSSLFSPTFKFCFFLMGLFYHSAFRWHL